MKEKYYITTAIAYTSRKPHIGNTYEVVLTDAIARYKRQRNYDVFFLTGTDEHGQKIGEAAKESGITPQQYVDGVAGEIKNIWNLMNTSYDHFIRTTDEYHVKAVQQIFNTLYEQGDIYKGEYEGWYCVPCEAFFTQTQLVDGCCPDCGREVKKTKEEAYFFKMSKYQDRLMKHIEEHPDFIQPESRKREMINNFLKPGLQDLCVSRTSFDWGIPVTFDNGHVIYVWIDALSNYITALGYTPEGESDLYKKYWPADVHVIGKDILRFHTIYWPIMLMALGEPLPKQIFGHPWLLAGADKISKSRGNAIYADDLVKLFGVDAVRYYLLSEMPYAQDGTISYENIINRYNTDLANILGNLVNRTVAMQQKYFNGIIANPCDEEECDVDLKAFALQAAVVCGEKMDAFKTAEALSEIMNLARRSNKYIDETTPWTLAKDESKKERLGGVLYNLIESIRFIAVLLMPHMPETAENIFEQIGATERSWESLSVFGHTVSGTSVGQATALFARLDEKKMLEEIENSIKKEQEQAKNATKESEKGATAENISIEDFAKLQMKIGLVLESNRVEGADKLLVSKIKIGDEVRQIVSGIAKHYTPEDFVGKKVVVLTNLKPVKLRGVLSEGMILAASDGDKLGVLTTDIDLPDGTTIR
ncbi:MAG: methionine--tRNA ligase [Ruminococcaceae bacterium]|nr:methionine--tRNA ligase [Oscillospiraceae bacterium]